MRKKPPEEPEPPKPAKKMEIKDIQSVIDLMNENDLSYFLLEQDGITLKLKKGADEVAVAAPAPVAPAAPAVEEAPVPDKGTEITSPMVGTFYRSPSPDSDSFVKVGDHVDEDTTVCIIEAMKVMNEIKADANGVIQRIVGEEGKPVQYGQALFIISPS
ncbi:MAG: acetyl-CoA carboxylase biotin carboxyl carrier protein [Verrucomicrobiales bacterium]|jgi:acetyl-CoA carboxylase biotin carboxyl carrier protein